MILQTIDSHSIIHYDRALAPRDRHAALHRRALRLAKRDHER